MDDIDVFEAIYSQRQFTRYKTDTVPREAIDKIIDAATKAPSGGNAQPWHFIAITERDLIEKIGGLYRDLCRFSSPTSMSWTTTTRSDF